MRIIRPLPLFFAILLSSLVGCGEIRVPLGSGLGPVTTSLEGNWQFTVMPIAGAAPFSELSGAINTVANASNGGQVGVTSVLLSPSNNCFAGTTVVPFHGVFTGATLQLLSFSVDGQLATLLLNQSSMGDQLDGTYAVSGGCADHFMGTLNGVRYQTLQGTFYSAVASSGQGMTLQLQQANADSGDGTFPVMGTVEIASSSCSTQGTLIPAEGTVSGKHVQLVFALHGEADAGQLILIGEINPAADELTFQQATIQGGSCAGDLGMLQLSKGN